MSQPNPVLYGRRLYARTMYAWNYDAETFSLVFNDGIGMVDAFNDELDKILNDVITLVDNAIQASTEKVLIDSTTLTDVITTSFGKALTDSVAVSDSPIETTGTKLLNDSIVLGESFVTNFVKELSETLTLSDSLVREITRTLNDSLRMEDSVILTTVTTALQDLLLLQDWLSIRLSKPSIWTVEQKQIPYSSLYGIILYGRSLYSGIGGVAWQTVKPAFTKGTITGKPNSWKSFNELEDKS